MINGLNFRVLVLSTLGVEKRIAQWELGNLLVACLNCPKLAILV
jgi:hypothetical protein